MDIYNLDFYQDKNTIAAWTKEILKRNDFWTYQ